MEARRRLLGRREALIALIAAASSSLGALQAAAQVPGKVYRLGYYRRGDPAVATRVMPRGRLHRVMEEELARHGFVVGQNLRVEEVFEAQVEGGRDKAMRELVALKPDVILVRWADRVMHLGRHTRTIPIVFFDVGMLTQRPPNSTGVVSLREEIIEKKLEVVRELLPGIEEVGLVATFGYVRRIQPDYPAAYRDIAARLNLRVVEADLELMDEDLDATLKNLKAKGVRAFIHDGVPVHVASMDALARKHRLVLVGSGGPTQGVASLEVDWDDHMRRACWALVKVLRGARPADVPLDRDRKLILSLNPALARQLDVKIPPALLIRAQRIVEK